MLINVVDKGEIRVAIASDNTLEELYIEKSGGEFVHGNIFKGKVENVEPNLQAAFVNIGGEKNGFLHTRDVIPPFGGYDGILKRRRRKAPKDNRRMTIDQMLYKGQEALVQITREALSTKGPSLTTYVSLPGRYLVLMPAVKKRGVSRKITDEKERNELKKVLDKLHPEKDMGFIIRTAGMGKGSEELQRDLDYLTRLWEAICSRAKKVKGPKSIYQESDLVIRAIRDYFNDTIDELIIDSQEEYERACEFLEMLMPDCRNRAVIYEGKEPMFHHYGVEKGIDRIFNRSVRLKSGGELIIEQTEAMVTIDVNTGSFLKGNSSREMIKKINLEAADEIARQLRLRDLGGLIMIDFIDMPNSEDRAGVEDKMRQSVRLDRARTTMLPISALGVMEMTRQRLRQSLRGTHYNTCPACKGSGMVKSSSSLALEFLRNLKAEIEKTGQEEAIIKMHPQTAFTILNSQRSKIHEIEQEYCKRIKIIPDGSLRIDEIVFLTQDESAAKQ